MFYPIHELYNGVCVEKEKTKNKRKQKYKNNNKNRCEYKVLGRMQISELTIIYTKMPKVMSLRRASALIRKCFIFFVLYRLSNKMRDNIESRFAGKFV